MFLCYADESGFNGRAFNASQPVQIIAAVFPNVYNLHRTEVEFGNRIADICHRNNVSGELKAEQVYRGRGPWARVHYQQRDEAIEVYLSWLNNRRHKILISALDNATYFNYVSSNPTHPCSQALPYPYLGGAFHIAMMIQRLNCRHRNNKGRTILIFDEQADFESKVADLIHSPPEFSDLFCKYDDSGSDGRFSQIVDTAYFVKSHHARMAQISDVIAYISRLWFELNHYGLEEKYVGERNKINHWYQMINTNHIGFDKAFPRTRGMIFDFLRSVAANGI